MPVRRFDGVDDRITCAIGGTNFVCGPATVAVVLRKRADATGAQTPIWFGTSGTTARWGMKFGPVNKPQIHCGSTATVQAPVIDVTVAEDWVIVVVSKATGTVAPRFHLYDFSTQTWEHEDGATSIANSATPGSSLFFGARSTTDLFDGDIGMAAVWNSVLSDAEVEALEAEAAWSAAPTPAARWKLDQASTATALQDDVGAADQTSIVGTTVIEEDIPWGSGTSDPATMGVATASGVGPRAAAASGVGAAAASAAAQAAAAAATAGVAAAAGISPERAFTTVAPGAAAGSSASPAGAAHASPASATAAGVNANGSVAAPVAPGQAVGVSVSPSAAASAGAGAAAASGAQLSAAAAVTPGSAAGSGSAPGSAASNTAPPGVAVALGIAPTDGFGQPPVTPGVATAAGVSPSGAAALGAFSVTATGVTPAAAAAAGRGEAVVIGTAPNSSAAASVTPGQAAAAGLAPSPAALLTGGLAAGTGANGSAAARVMPGVAVGLGIAPGSPVAIVFPGSPNGWLASDRSGSLAGVDTGRLEEPITGWVT